MKSVFTELGGAVTASKPHWEIAELSGRKQDTFVEVSCNTN